MSLRWRCVRREDLVECLAIDPRSTGEGLVGRKEALRLWHKLLGDLAFNAAVIELHSAGQPPRIVGFGASVFLRSGYLDGELARPQPDLNSRIFQLMQAQRSPVRTAKTLVSQEEADTLDLLLLASSYDMASLTPALQQEVTLMLPRSLVHLHSGYRVNRIVAETTQKWMRQMAGTSGLWQLIAHFVEEERAYFAVTREQAMNGASFTSLTPLFWHTSPRLELRDAEKELLCKAMHGATDAELAAELGLSLSSVKKRWSTLFARIAMRAPELLPDDGPGMEGQSRGLQKRHRILAHVREHAEEIRPFRWYPGS